MKARNFLVIIEFLILIACFIFYKPIVEFLDFPYKENLIIFITIGVAGTFVTHLYQYFKYLAGLETRNQELTMEQRTQKKFSNHENRITKNETLLETMSNGIKRIHTRMDEILGKLDETVYKIDMIQLTKNEREAFQKTLLDIMEDNKKDILSKKCEPLNKFHTASNIALIDFFTKIGKWNLKQVQIDHIESELSACLERIYADTNGFFGNDLFSEMFAERIKRDRDKYLEKVKIIVESPRNSKYIKFKQRSQEFLSYFNDRTFDVWEKYHEVCDNKNCENNPANQ